MFEMNHVINWIALNNGLMIQIGISSIVVLLLIYVFRLLFVPNVQVVGEEPEVQKLAESVSQDAPGTDAAQGSDPAVKNDLAEIANLNRRQDLEANEKLRSEIRNLREQLSKAETKISDLSKQKADSQTSKTEGAGVAESISNATADAGSEANPDLIAELNAKIQKLEARLFEYEIIAEDISEISQLRSKNEELTKQLEQLQINQPVENKAEETASVALLTDNLLDEVFSGVETQLDNPEEKDSIGEASEPPIEIVAAPDLNDALMEMAQESDVEIEPLPEEVSAPPVPEVKVEPIKIKVEKSLDVTGEEKELMAQFEEELIKKGAI